MKSGSYLNISVTVSLWYSSIKDCCIFWNPKFYYGVHKCHVTCCSFIQPNCAHF